MASTSEHELGLGVSCSGAGAGHAAHQQMDYLCHQITGLPCTACASWARRYPFHFEPKSAKGIEWHFMLHGWVGGWMDECMDGGG